MSRLTERKLEVMRQRAQAVQDQAAYDERLRVRAELMASPMGRMVMGVADALVAAFQPGAWHPLFASAEANR
jgi:hypothetical protein